MSDYIAQKKQEVDDVATDIVTFLTSKKVSTHLGMAACLKIFLSSAAVNAKSRNEYDHMIDNAVAAMNATRESYYEIVDGTSDFKKSFN